MKLRRLRRPEVSRDQAIALVREFDEDAVMDHINSQQHVTLKAYFYGINQQKDVSIVLNKDKTWDFIRDEEQ